MTADQGFDDGDDDSRGTWLGMSVVLITLTVAFAAVFLL
jgi:hypothetical protein